MDPEESTRVDVGRATRTRERTFRTRLEERRSHPIMGLALPSRHSPKDLVRVRRALGGSRLGVCTDDRGYFPSQLPLPKAMESGGGGLVRRVLVALAV